MGYFISIIISLGVGLVTGYWFKGSHEIVARSLQKELNILKCPNPISCATTSYYTVYLTAKKGNWYCQLLSFFHIPVRLVVSGTVRWIPSDDGVGFTSDLYPVGPGRRVQENAYNFIITPNAKIELAVAEEENFNVCPLGRNDWVILTNCDHNLHIDLFNLDNEQLPRLTIENYIEANRGI